MPEMTSNIFLNNEHSDCANPSGSATSFLGTRWMYDIALLQFVSDPPTSNQHKDMKASP